MYFCEWYRCFLMWTIDRFLEGRLYACLVILAMVFSGEEHLSVQVDDEE